MIQVDPGNGHAMVSKSFQLVFQVSCDDAQHVLLEAFHLSGQFTIFFHGTFYSLDQVLLLFEGG